MTTAVCVDGDCFGVGPTGTLELRSQAWPHACDPTEGGGVYCDAGAGLRTDPPHTALGGGGAGAGTQTILWPGGACGVLTQISQRLAAASFTNPSPCRAMVVSMQINGRLRADADGGQFENPVPVSSGVNVLGEYRINGGAWIAYRNATWDSDATADSVSTVGGDHITPPLTLTIPPGGNVVIDTRIRVTCANTNSVVRFVVNEPQISLMGVTQ
ncbi:hypothetical protein ACFWVB_20220 [Streptomyces microflavus]|uniref:hypothetical protein n=1 Tax=Streptomyces microflavus TaxID=1919 RepID=UPI0036654CB8